MKNRADLLYYFIEQEEIILCPRSVEIASYANGENPKTKIGLSEETSHYNKLDWNTQNLAISWKANIH